MNAWIYGYIAMSSVTGILALIFFFAFKPIMLRINAFFKKKKGFIYVTELRKDRGIHHELSKFSGSKITLEKNRTYGIKKEHIHLDYMYGIPAVVVSEETGTSIDPKVPDGKEENFMSTQLVESLIMESILSAVGEKLLKLIQLGYIVVGFIGFVLLVVCGLILIMLRAMSQAGIKISL